MNKDNINKTFIIKSKSKIFEIPFCLEPNFTDLFNVSIFNIPSLSLKRFSNLQLEYTEGKLTWKPVTFEFYSFMTPSVEFQLFLDIVETNILRIPKITIDYFGCEGQNGSKFILLDSELKNIDFGENDHSKNEIRSVKLIVQPTIVKFQY